MSAVMASEISQHSKSKLSEYFRKGYLVEIY